MGGTFVPPYKIVQAARKTATAVRNHEVDGVDALQARSVAASWDKFADEIQSDAEKNGYWF